MGEFELIRRFFTRPTPQAVLGVGDDCALLSPRAGMHLAISTDMLVADRHFFADTDPERLGHKALAVNLSDLAACGARPLAFTLALSLPSVDEAWLDALARGMLALADAHGCELVGGDTTRGPLNLCITVFGEVPAGQALLRSGAQAGDDIYVSGTLGDAHLALQALLGQQVLEPALLQAAQQRLEQPTPRLALGLALRGVATAAADISDGLAGDLGHILERSQCGATLEATALQNCMASRAGLPSAQVLQHVLTGGDDYELVFTAPPAARAAVAQASQASGTPVSRIGQIDPTPGLRLCAADGRIVAVAAQGFDHFAAAGAQAA